MPETAPAPAHMTAADFARWVEQMGFSQEEAATRLGLSRSCVQQYLRGARKGSQAPVEIPKSVRLACSAIAMGVIDYSGPPPGLHRRAA